MPRFGSAALPDSYMTQGSAAAASTDAVADAAAAAAVLGSLQDMPRAAHAPPRAPTAERCSSCGARKPGPTATYKWRRHPVTRERLCRPCVDRVTREAAGRPPAGDLAAPPPPPEQPSAEGSWAMLQRLVAEAPASSSPQSRWQQDQQQQDQQCSLALPAAVEQSGMQRTHATRAAAAAAEPANKRQRQAGAAAGPADEVATLLQRLVAEQQLRQQLQVRGVPLQEGRPRLNRVPGCAMYSESPCTRPGAQPPAHQLTHPLPSTASSLLLAGDAATAGG